MVATLDANARLLVTGASGQLGQLVLAHLLHTLKIDPSHIVAGSRNPAKLQKFADRGVITRHLDYDDAASVEMAAHGVDRALLISSKFSPTRLVGHQTAITAMVQAGVKHILFTSFHNIDNTVAFVKDDFAGTEAFLRTSKVPGYTFLRNGLYFENDLGSIKNAKASGKWYSAAQDGRIASLSRNDLALANAVALASADYTNQVYELTGVQGLTIDEIAANVSKVIGKKIDVVHVSVDSLVQGMVAAMGISKEFAKAVVSFDENAAQGLASSVTTDFKTLTGRDPISHEMWVEANTSMLQAL